MAENNLNSDGYDLAGQGNGSFTGSNNLVVYDATGTLNGNDNLLGVTDPGIGLLANNGGPTQTIALLAGSPAIDAGSNALAVDPTTGDPLAYDQRGAGFPRIVNGTVDIGAFERPSYHRQSHRLYRHRQSATASATPARSPTPSPRPMPTSTWPAASSSSTPASLTPAPPRPSRWPQRWS